MGIEPTPPAWRAGILTIIRPRRELFNDYHGLQGYSTQPCNRKRVPKTLSLFRRLNPSGGESPRRSPALLTPLTLTEQDSVQGGRSFPEFRRPRKHPNCGESTIFGRLTVPCLRLF